MRGLPPFPNLRDRIREFLFHDDIACYLKSMRMIAYYEDNQKICGGGYYYHRLRFKRLGMRLGFTIGAHCFGYGLVIPHYGTIVVNGAARAGNYCVLHTSTCIAGGEKTIGDGLYLSAGAILTGKLALGNHVSIAANSLVNAASNGLHSVLLAGSPASPKRESEPWWIRDGFTNRIEAVEELKVRMLGARSPEAAVTMQHPRKK